MRSLQVLAPDGVPEVGEGDDLADLIVTALGAEGLVDGDVVLVTSKVVAKAEGRVVAGERDDLVPAETVRVVARRGPTSIVRTRHGLVLAAAGIDASNVAAGQVVLLPEDPDASARRLRARLHERTGAVVGVLVTDTAGRAWRTGQTDIAIGAAGLAVATSYVGRTDAYGNPLRVTEPAVADELAGAAELAQDKLGGRPFAVVRGRADLVLAPDDDGPGAVALVRPEAGDLFGYGAREAVVAAVFAGLTRRGDPVFGEAAGPDELAAALVRALGHAQVATGTEEVRLDVEADLAPLAAVVGAAHGWQAGPPLSSTDAPPGGTVEVRFRPVTP